MGLIVSPLRLLAPLPPPRHALLAQPPPLHVPVARRLAAGEQRVEVPARLGRREAVGAEAGAGAALLEAQDPLGHDGVRRLGRDPGAVRDVGELVHLPVQRPRLRRVAEQPPRLPPVPARHREDPVHLRGVACLERQVRVKQGPLLRREVHGRLDARRAVGVALGAGEGVADLLEDDGVEGDHGRVGVDLRVLEERREDLDHAADARLLRVCESAGLC